jgi:hypothetical protein
MKSFQKYLENLDMGLRKELEAGMDGVQFTQEQEKQLSIVFELLKKAIEESPSRVMTMLKTMSASSPEMTALYDQIDLSQLRMAAKKHSPTMGSSPDEIAKNQPDSMS